MKKLCSLVTILILFCGHPLFAADISDFFGAYTGSAKVEDEGGTVARDMGVRITQTDTGFKVTWTSITHKQDGRLKEKKYTIGFVPSARENIYASAMKTNVFGKPEPLDPLNGEPFVWTRISGDTF